MSPARRYIVPVVLLFTVFSTLEGSLENWGSWGSCSKTCGSGSQSRSRACNSTAALTAGTNCSVTLSETQSCNVHACSSCSGNVQADIVFVMDASRSVGDANFQTMKEFVRDQVDSFDIDANNIRVGVLKFSTTADTEFNLNDFLDKDAIKNNIMNINYTGGYTYTGVALSYMLTTMFTPANGDREGVNNTAVIITGGQSNSFTHTADQARAARNANITIFSIGISSGSSVGELSEMASKPDSDYLFTVANFSALSGIHTAFQAKACVPAPPVFTNCGGQLSGQGGQIVSPNFPDHYPNNSLCVWTITGLPGDDIRVSFSRLDLENSPDCHQDSLSFRDGADGTASLLRRVCNAVLPSDITSTVNVMYVRFVTDLESSGTGFNITWTAKCLETYTFESGAIQTYGVANSNRACTYIIRQPQAYVIHLQFYAFHVGNDTVNCTTNYVEVRDGDDEGSPLLGQRYCGTDIPPLLRSSQNMTWIRYVTDGSDIGPRFSAEYWRAEPCPTVVLTERNGTFTSPSFPANYSDGMYCTWQITTETDNVIRLTFASFSLEYHPNCIYDWVDILDGATSRGRYCGESGPGTVTSSSNRFTVTFKTDYFVTRRGFSASYVTYPSSATRICPEDGDWAETPGGNTVPLSCPQGYADGGVQYRQCDTDGQWSEPDTSQCVRQELEDLKTTIDQIGTGKTNETTKDVVEKLQNSTGGSRPLLSGDVTAAVEILDKVANFTVDTNQAPGKEELGNFVMIADNVLHASSDVWQDQTTKALSLVNAVDRMGKASSRTLNSSGSQRPITSNKIVLQVGRSNRNDIVFPAPSQMDNYPPWVTAANNSAFLSKDALNESLVEVGYSAVIFRNLSNVFSGQVNQTLTGLSELSINSPILALSLALDVDLLLKPVRLTFDHIMVNFSSASCQFLDFSASAKGTWSTKGCRVTKSNSTMTVCECDHLTNFAVLMSPYRPANEVADVLNIFSVVGCSISIFCLVLTLVIYFIFWRYVKSDRSVLLVHLCVVLVLAYVTFLAGVNRVENEIVCTVVAGLLHYLWLVVFFLMLCEGIDIFITIVIIFPTKSVLAWLLLTAYGVPVIIVGVSMGVTKSEGYGGTVFCWLSLEEGLVWAFVGPAVAALVANFVVIVIVIYTLLNSRVMIMKEKRERAKSVVKAICVMTPILGLSWIFGVMSVNDDTVVFQILFVVFNSLQGLMIFILHCLLSKQVKEGMQHKLRRYQTNSKGVDDSSSKYVTQKQTSESNISSNDLDRKTISPFLQADQQVQQMASNMTSNGTPKVKAVKNPVAGITRAPPAHGPPLNIRLNESTMDGREDQRRRLDHVYGAGTRIPDYNIMRGAYARSRGGRFFLSAPYIGLTPPLRNPVYNHAVPALLPTGRWVRVAPSTKPQQQQRRGQQHPPVRHPSGPSPFRQPHPSSFYRLAASADNLGSVYYQPFATPGQIHQRHGNRRQAAHVDAQPSMLYHEPPVDYP